MASSQHRCVFVGNIPYDATEEQLIEICREVGPVVSFRLVIDRETGKPKGYGFCEYKDEETALSARRNLQGYEINGRQLRVDFAENDKGADRNREQGRVGPGLAANADSQKQLGGPASHGETAHHQPIGLHIAISASTVMSRVLGGSQAGIQSNQNGLQRQSASNNDPLTLLLAKMSRSQLNEILSELKAITMQNKEMARQLLLARPQLLKALFQAQIMLGMVTPQVLQMPNIRLALDQPTQALLQEPGLQPGVQILPGLPPLAQKMQPALMPKVQGQVSLLPQNSLVHKQFSAPLQPPMQPQFQLPQQANSHVPLEASFPGQSGVSTNLSIHSTVRPQIQVANSSSLSKNSQLPLLQNLRQVETANLGCSSQIVLSNASLQSSLLPRPPLSDAHIQPGPSTSSGIPDAVSRDADRSALIPDDATCILRNNAYSNMSLGLAEKRSIHSDLSAAINHPSKYLKLDDGRSSSISPGGFNVTNVSGSISSQSFGVSVPVNLNPKLEELQSSEKQILQDFMTGKMIGKGWESVTAST
ncbi:RRM_1 domain-containing protein/CSTF2_hinge domain-containing protein [Cephalotus follicularis]|uniref:RRM_1 domain-containing protein/CSTF2_hinge domain-containing protein n=1 Tax=Cephalotus follicularis TaxID=3775 RepID=A0A1Q3CRW8_CEPFO|nr:RRM_1 domain-containing protein/CSTF2_hinge domain-containing protein [Cephalotus follicularis]